MASNFDFLQLRHPDLHAEAVTAEALALTAPRAACITARFVLELGVQWLYEHDRGLSRPYEDKLGALIHESSFRDNMPAPLFFKVQAVYKAGNYAAHRAAGITPKASRQAVEDLFHFLYWLSRTYAPDVTKHPKVGFNPALLPQSDAQRPAENDAKVAALQAAHEARLAEEAARHAQQQAALTTTEAELGRLQAELARLKAANQAVPDDHDYDEAATRDRFIDLLLREAGWAIDRPGVDTERPVQGMPNDSGNGFVDYVLWGADGRPLALVEAKRTRHSVAKGKHQAKLYADCLQAEFGRRPVIFLSNGFQHYVWADGPPREVQAFYTREELEQHHWAQANQLATATVGINDAIVNRGYQQEAIRAVLEHFERGHRRALVVMATGTGKTRTVIALIDLMLRANRVKRVLFLADRKPLLGQAHRAFLSHLGRVSTVDLRSDSRGIGAVYLCTLQKMTNLIDRFDGALRRFGPGFFDLVVIDEAHRSIYKKYGDLFTWFDGRLLGLTATPRGEVSHDTYALFQIESRVPTFNYDLDQAVTQRHLVPPHGKTVPFAFLREGIKYADLSAEEKEAYEDTFTDDETGALPDVINTAALNAWVFNTDTVDKALDFVMEHGLKVEQGTRLGKTIIFAKNHRHAEFIVERFDKKWPAYAGHFCQVIDSHNDYAEDLLLQFAKRHAAPHIAVSVSMLDTGVDVPEVVNLVFFTATASRTRFHQMVGRGTRLCPDLFGPGQHKTHFLVFDLCGNFAFFGGEPPEDVGAPTVTLPEALVRYRADLARRLQPADADGLRASLLDHLHAHVQGLDLTSFRVRPHRAQTDALGAREAWDPLTSDALLGAAADLAGLPSTAGSKEALPARQFDGLILRLQITLLSPGAQLERLQSQLQGIAQNLLEKADHIGVIHQQRDLLMTLGEDAWWQGVTVAALERVRRALRDLAGFVERTARAIVETSFEDTLMTATDEDVPLGAAWVDADRYRRKVEDWLRGHLTDVAVFKLHHNKPLTDTDIAHLEAMVHLASEGHTEAAIGKERLPTFVRRVVGLDPASLRAELDAYIGAAARTSQQIRFIEGVIAFLSKNGVMDPERLFSQQIADERTVMALTDEQTAPVIAFVRRVNENGGWEGERAVG